MILFGLVIVVVHIDAELDLFYGNRLLVFLGFALFLFLLIEIFPVVHDAADRRLRRGRNLNQVQVFAFGQLKRFEGRHYADLFTFVSDHANFARSNAVIGSDKTFIDTVLRALSDCEYGNYSMGVGRIFSIAPRGWRILGTGDEERGSWLAESSTQIPSDPHL